MTRIWKIIAAVAALIGGVLIFLRPNRSNNSVTGTSPFEQPKKELQDEKEKLEKELVEVKETEYTDKDEIEKKYNS